MIILNKSDLNPPDMQARLAPGALAVQLDITVISKEGSKYAVKPAIILKDSTLDIIPDTVLSQSMVLKFNRIVDEQKGILEIGIKEDRRMNDIVTLKVYAFPFINVLWIGIVIMIIGFVMSMYRRIQNMKLRAV